MYGISGLWGFVDAHADVDYDIWEEEVSCEIVIVHCQLRKRRRVWSYDSENDRSMKSR
jgi:hypothetical protein